MPVVKAEKLIKSPLSDVYNSHTNAKELVDSDGTKSRKAYIAGSLGTCSKIIALD